MDLLPYIYDCSQEKQDFIMKFHDALHKQYPGIQIRWMRIYGKRWAHMYGDGTVIALQPLKIQLNQDYGICIDNPELIPSENLDELIAVLKEYFK